MWTYVIIAAALVWYYQNQ